VRVFSYAVGQFSQYILLLVWLRWQQLRLQSQPPDAAPEQAPAKEAAPILRA
jgi:hypothetical protein